MQFSPTMRRSAVARRAALTVGLVFSLGSPLFAGCTPGALTNGMADTPDLPDDLKCDPNGLNEVISPYVMEWPTGARADLEEAMSEGVVVVSYSCDGVKVLPDCKLSGSYGYKAVTPKTEDNLIEGRDNINASFGGMGFGVDAKMERSAKLDMSYVLVGKHKTTRATVTAGDLPADDFCKGATHFVKRADVGAWTLVTGKAVQAGIAAKIMNQGAGAESANKEMKSKTDGDPAKCKGATRKDAEAPGGCGALIKVSLAPIKGSAKLSKADNLNNTGIDDGEGCVAGFVLDGGVCKRAAKAQAPACERGDDAGCKKQCLAGSDVSCTRYANIFLYNAEGADSSSAPAMFKAVSEVSKRMIEVCKNAESASACFAAGFSVFGAMQSGGMDETEAAKQLVEYMSIACAAGDPKGCGFLRTTLVDDDDLAEKIGVDGKKLYGDTLQRGCKGGAAVPCGFLAFEAAVGTVLPQDVAGALKGAESACLGNWSQACFLRAALLSDEAGCNEAINKMDDISKKSFETLEICTEEILSQSKEDSAGASKAMARGCSLGGC